MTGAIGANWRDVRNELFTPEEIKESDLRVSLIGEFIKARREQDFSRRLSNRAAYLSGDCVI